MRALTITNTAVNLNAQKAPFNPGYTVVMFNTTAGALTVQESDASGGTYTTLATIPANTAQEVKLNLQYIKVSTAANVQLLGN